MAPRGPVLELLKMKEQGLVDAVGISGGPVAMLQRFVETDFFDVLLTHNRYTLVDRSANALLDSATRRGMGVNNAAPYGGGILTGDPRFRGKYGYRTIRPAVQSAVDSVTELCERYGISLAAAALQFSLRDPRIHSTIIGATSLGRIEDTLRECAEHAPEELWAAIDEVVPDDRFALDAQLTNG
jgi:D-threo-aldose 1-dehydrogenase